MLETSTNGAGAGAAVEAAAAGREDQGGVAELGFVAGGGARPRADLAGQAPEVHGEVQAGDPREGRRVHGAGRDRRAAASRGAVHVASDVLAQAAQGRGAARARAVAWSQAGRQPRRPDRVADTTG